MTDPHGRAPHNKKGALPCITYSAYTDDLWLVSRTATEAVDMLQTMKKTIAKLAGPGPVGPCRVSDGGWLHALSVFG